MTRLSDRVKGGLLLAALLAAVALCVAAWWPTTPHHNPCPKSALTAYLSGTADCPDGMGGK